jgi:hypothetical protein
MAKKWQFKVETLHMILGGSLERHVQCSAVQWRHTSVWCCLQKIKHCSLTTEGFFSFTSSSQAASLLIFPRPVAAAGFLFQSLSWNTVMPAAVSPGPCSHLQNRHGPLLALFSFFKSALLPNLNKIVDCELLIMGVQQLEDTFSIVLTNFRSFLNPLKTKPICFI